ncbi:tagaturonate epimerase family protein [Shumkonia mesophila]|uniref:tagaturonate epimerase family protein n=1 Tax=Shumkonia mesophila TaxID=2838854 RepID=UPI0029349EBB|nr:tagaturonate epimerase family protein [Shumkonia mesophila]
MIHPTPAVIGLRKSFGFGDRLGLATPGHVAACRKTDFIPIFAQQSIREMVRTKRSPEDVMADAQRAVMRTAYKADWGADADHLKTEDDVRATAAAGFTFFTFDPSDHVVNEADTMGPEELARGETALIAEGVFEGSSLRDLYLGKRFEIDNGFALTFDEPALLRAAVKYGRAVRHCARLAAALKEAAGGRPYEIEMSVDESEVPTTPLEHLFVARELKRRGVEFISLAPRFIGDFEKAVDYRGDLAAFEASIGQHVAIAKFCGPYKLSLHSGSDKFSVYPIFGRLCGEMLHVKTAGTSYLEALRVVVRVDRPFFRELVEYCRGRFATDRASYHLSTTEADVERLGGVADGDLERMFLDLNEGRQLMHVTYGSVLTLGQDARGRPFRERLMAILEKHAEMHLDFVERHFDKHLGLLLAE